MLRLITLIAISAMIFSCSTTQKQTTPKEINPAAEGFDAEGSDAEAIAIADEVMEAMGGRENWDATRFIKWNFFGSRTLTWDKLHGRVRIESHRDSSTYLVNIFDGTGKVSLGGEEMTDADSLTKYLEIAKGMWINDSYWLVMPFKLKDSGVTLTYVGEDTTQSGETSDLLELTFKDVGFTPQNKYQVWVGKESRLVNQWAFYGQASDPEPRFVMPWNDYQPHGKIKLSGNRGQRSLEDIEVAEVMDDAIFENLD